MNKDSLDKIWRKIFPSEFQEGDVVRFKPSVYSGKTVQAGKKGVIVKVSETGYYVKDMKGIYEDGLLFYTNELELVIEDE